MNIKCRIEAATVLTEIPVEGAMGKQQPKSQAFDLRGRQAQANLQVHNLQVAALAGAGIHHLDHHISWGAARHLPPGKPLSGVGPPRLGVLRHLVKVPEPSRECFF